MWTCPKCNEQNEDQRTSCSKCAAGAPPPIAQPPVITPPKKERPLQLFESIALVVAAMPGILYLSGGRVQNSNQAIFRIAVFAIGVTAYVAIKIYQHIKKGQR